MALQGPIERVTHDTLREAVLAHRESQRRHSFAPVLHMGSASHVVAHVVEARPRLDVGAQVDLVMAMIQSSSRAGVRPHAWLTRPGELSLHDVDVSWSSAVRWAAAATDTCVPFVVVTKQGWFDPESGVRREWRRLRRRRP